MEPPEKEEPDIPRSKYEVLENEGEGSPIMHKAAHFVDTMKHLQVEVPLNKGLKKFLAYAGPGFLVSIAYMDPGNFESDLQAGAKYKFELLWVLVLATIAGAIVQSLASNLGVVTGKHLAEHCKFEYPPWANYVLWVFAELAIVASDIPEVIGTAYALNMLFHLDLWLGVILTGFSTLVFLALQRYGVRKLEIFIFFLVVTIASCFFIELRYAEPSYTEIFYGLIIPRLRGDGAFAIAISLVGAMVMPHNLYLHSALVLTRKTPRTVDGIRDGCRYNLLECSLALMVSFIINVAVVSVSGAVCNSEGISLEDAGSCQDLDLNRAAFLLKNSLGSWSSTVFAIALLASGQSSTITGTYAGQYVMEGFLDLKFSPWIRNFLTRCVAIVPSLIVALIGGSSGAGKLIIASSMILSFELPFALIPLLKFTSNSVKMGCHVNSKHIIGVAWSIGTSVILINLYFLSTQFIHWIHISTLSKPILWVLVIFGSCSLLAYSALICYLTFRTDKTETYSLPDMAENFDPFEDETADIELNGYGPLIVTNSNQLSVK